MPNPLQKDLRNLGIAWMHFAGGETSAERPGTTRMMFLAVFMSEGKVRVGYLPAGRPVLEQSLIDEN